MYRTILQGIVLTALGLFLQSCAQVPKTDWQEWVLENSESREPSSELKVKAESSFKAKVKQVLFKPQVSAKDKKILRCGQLSYTDNPYNQVDVEDAKYVMRLDCNLNYTVDASDGEHYAVFETVSPQQKGWFNRYARAARAQSRQKSGMTLRSPVPFVCTEAEADQDPCAVKGNFYILNKPIFTSDIGAFKNKFEQQMKSN